MDNVMHIIDEDGRVVLFFIGDNRDRPYSWYFEGVQAENLRAWLNDNSSHI